MLRVADENGPAVGSTGEENELDPFPALRRPTTLLARAAAASLTGNTRKRLDDALDDVAPQQTGDALFGGQGGGTNTPVRPHRSDKRMRTTEDIFASLRISDDATMHG